MTPELLRSLAAHRETIDRRLRHLVPRALPGQTPLDEAIAASVLAPGKRLRPMMTVLVTMDLGGDVGTAVDAGCAVEMVHAASLTLDDLPSMDDATMRRGRPAVHAAYGEDIAILAAIAALSGAFETLARLSGASDHARAECVAILTRAVGVSGLVAGQFADLREGAYERDVTDIAATNSLKTGSLFSAAVEIGAVVAGADHGVRLELRRFASELGHAFQLLDDLLDHDGDAGLTGKDVGKDVGKSTIGSVLGRDLVLGRIADHVAGAHRHLDASVGPKSLIHACVDFIFEEALPADAARAATGREGVGAK
ncbi:polyprenyl synthetase family protein [Jiella sonneratiae]|uniref:Polyprenyl synthetase family protein n=1 Tax=Jiella sonneratiae TaxID=2816856 RepID=A0ABS3J8E4_9HYPH|nr:polyprenyl synthetase family protein [Jiella sonneratiae]MBO0905945.1 polyprenyl synthetase family protein [Jiella sonneratiae]